LRFYTKPDRTLQATRRHSFQSASTASAMMRAATRSHFEPRRSYVGIKDEVVRDVMDWIEGT
jgi:hypothetical protein